MNGLVVLLWRILKDTRCSMTDKDKTETLVSKSTYLANKNGDAKKHLRRKSIVLIC